MEKIITDEKSALVDLALNELSALRDEYEELTDEGERLANLAKRWEITRRINELLNRN